MEKIYSSKQAAIRGMWRRYDTLYRHVGGSPLRGDNGTILQWCHNGETSYLSVEERGGYYDTTYALIDSTTE